MTLKKLFNKLAELAASADFSNFSANDHLHQMALDDHHRAHNQASSDDKYYAYDGPSFLISLVFLVFVFRHPPLEKYVCAEKSRETEAFSFSFVFCNKFRKKWSILLKFLITVQNAEGVKFYLFCHKKTELKT